MEIRFEIDGFKGWNDFQPVINAIDPGRKYIEQALRTTNVRMSDWLKTRLVSRLARVMKMKQAPLRARFKRLRIDGGGSDKGVWCGLDGIPFSHLKPYVFDKGVKTGDGGHYVQGAFIRRPRRGGGERVFKRLYEKNSREHHGYPIEEVKLDIYAKALPLMDDLLNGSEFEYEYMRRLERDLAFWATK